MTEVVECIIPPLAACQNSNANRKAWATVNVTAWAWDRRGIGKRAFNATSLVKGRKKKHIALFLCQRKCGLNRITIYRQKERQGVSLTHEHMNTHSPLSSWCRGTRDTPVFRCLDSERCRRTLYRASYPLCSTKSYRQQISSQSKDNLCEK